MDKSVKRNKAKKIFKITERQLHYLDNIFESNKQNDAFWRWFQGSKVVNDDGSPKEVYHGTPNTFDSFDTSLIFLTDNKRLASDYSSSKRFIDKGNVINPKIKAIMGKDYGSNDLNILIKDLVSTGLFKVERKYSSPYSNEMSNMLVNTDTDDETNADYTRVDLIKRWLSRSYEGGILRLYARIVKPFVIDAKGRRFDNLNGNGSGIAEDFVKEAKAKGCDGIIIYNVVDGNMRKVNEYIVFSPNQVKSAYDNNGDYSLVSDNMYECIKK